MAKIVLIIGLLIVGYALIYVWMDIFGGIRREMEDGTEEWEKLKAEG